jgi:hypothetical protein
MELSRWGLVIEENLSEVTTYSVGQVRVADLVESYYGTQRLTQDSCGARVYGGSDHVVVRRVNSRRCSGSTFLQTFALRTASPGLRRRRDGLLRWHVCIAAQLRCSAWHGRRRALALGRH